MNDISRLELQVYSDASEKAFVATTYRVEYRGEVIHQNKSFVTGKAKVVPKFGPTIPRMKLCTDETFFYSDSGVVLGYTCIQNKTRRF